MEKGIHDGHRERLMRTVYEGDFNTLSPYQQVEVLLCYIFPRGDVNPLAHKLYDRFRSFYAILDADIKDLQSVKGIGENSAIKIKNLIPFCFKPFICGLKPIFLIKFVINFIEGK